MALAKNDALTPEQKVILLHKDKINEIVKTTRQIKHQKTLTLTIINGKHEHKEKFDVNESGVFALGAKPVFDLMIAVGLENGGSLVLREFLPDLFLYQNEEGKNLRIPKDWF